MRVKIIPYMLVLMIAGCSDAEPWCDSAAGSAPSPGLQAPCNATHCVAGIVVDYLHLEPRGYRIFALEGDPARLAQAEPLARKYLVDRLEVASPDAADCEQDNDFFHCAMVYRETGDRYLVVIHRPTSQVLFAGLEIWADQHKRGFDFPLPQDFVGSGPLGCVDRVAAPVHTWSVTTGAPDVGAAPSTAEDALRLIRRLNVTREFIGDRDYEAFVISHGAAIGGFDPEAADWYVWLALK